MAKKKIQSLHHWQRQDPYYQREIEKYGENPLPSREFIMQCLEKEGRLLSFAEIINIFQLDEARVELFSHRLKAMIRAGQLMSNRQGQIGLSRKMDLVAGRVIAHPEGYGFLHFEGDEPDGFIPPKYMNELMHDDKILARVSDIDRQGRKDYAPVEILERGQARIVGKLSHLQGLWFVLPENRRLNRQFFIPDDKRNGAKNGEIVVAEIVEYPTRHSQAVAKILYVLGEERAAGMEVEIALENHNIPREFPEAVQQETAAVPEALRAQDYENRLDLRHLPFVTIDGISARDFDDAVFAEKRGANYCLYVAIADVSHYVKLGRPLDEEAHLRGTSVYFPDRVIPMLPEKLSNGLCSLNPHVDRLCMVCQITLAPDGSIKRSKFHEAVMHSHARLTYETAQKIIFDRDALLRESFAQLLRPLDTLAAVYEILKAAREARHTINFEFAEAEFEYDSEGKIESIKARERLEAHKLIEECMIVANIAAAKFLSKHKIPALYRVHDTPGIDRLGKLKQYLSRIGLGGKIRIGDSVSPQQLAQVLALAQGRPDYALIEKMLLRTMEQAVYSPKNRGHFGLALENYAHFTSPIRRYPDLLVHRAIRHILRGGTAENYAYNGEQMTELAIHTSMTERRADDATREAMDFLKCEFMSHRIGEEFGGQISNITSFGLFITLDDYFIDGLVHVSSLTNDYYHYDADTVSLTGERSGHVFRMLDQVRVRVAKVDIDDRKIDFALLNHAGKRHKTAASAPNHEATKAEKRAKKKVKSSKHQRVETKKPAVEKKATKKKRKIK